MTSANALSDFYYADKLNAAGSGRCDLVCIDINRQITTEFCIPFRFYFVIFHFIFIPDPFLPASCTYRICCNTAYCKCAFTAYIAYSACSHMLQVRICCNTAYLQVRTYCIYCIFCTFAYAANAHFLQYSILLCIWQVRMHCRTSILQTTWNAAGSGRCDLVYIYIYITDGGTPLLNIYIYIYVSILYCSNF